MKSNILVNKLVEQNIIKSEEADIYIYGLNYFLLYFVNIIISASFAFLLNSIPIYVFVLLAFISLRRFAGGFHFNHPVICILFSQVCLLLPQLLLPNIIVSKKWLFICFIFIYCSLLFVTKKKRAVCSKKRYTNEQLIQKNTRKSLFIEIVYIFIFLILFLFHQIVFASAILYVGLLQLLLLLIPEM